jgi:hypothetical protein
MTHDCRPPTMRRRVDATDIWRCPACGDLWTAQMIGPIHPEPALPFDIAEYITTAGWRRLRPTG